MISEYIKTLRRAVADENKLLNLLTTSATHVFSEHINQSNEKMLTRLIQKDTGAVSTFTSKSDMCFALRSAIMSQTQAIEKAVYGNKNFEKIPITFDYEEDEDESFNGFIMNDKGHIEHLKTRSITTVLRTNSNAPLGIELLTIYPNMYSETATKNNQNIVAKTIKESKMYADATTIQKAYFDFMLENPSAKVFFDNKETIHSQPHITLEYKAQNKNYQIYVEDNNISVQAMNFKKEPIYDKLNHIKEPIGSNSRMRTENSDLKSLMCANINIKKDLNAINTYIMNHNKNKKRKTLNVCDGMYKDKETECSYE